MYKRILVPVDGSATSAKGLEEAIRLAKLTGASLELDASRLKVCDGTQEFGSAGAAAHPDQPPPPVLTPNNSVVEPTQKRKFTIAECKRICAFPDDYVLIGTYSKQWERLGNSVPPLLMKAIAETVRDRILAKCR